MFFEVLSLTYHSPITITAALSGSSWLFTGRLGLASQVRAQTALIHTSPLKSPSTKMIWSGATKIIGTSADEESARYMVDRFRKIGLTDVRLQPFDLPPQWMPRSWEIAATAADRTVKLTVAQPAYATPATPSGGLEAEVAWAGTGTEADYIGRNVAGKVVVINRNASVTIRLDVAFKLLPVPRSTEVWGCGASVS